jgi:hypothetical protein
MTIRTYHEPKGIDPTRGARAPRWARWAALMMCAWSLLFAYLHFAAEAERAPDARAREGMEVDPLALVLCVSVLCLLCVVAALSLLQSRSERFPRWFMQLATIGGSALVAAYVVFSFVVNGFHWALAPGVLCIVGALVALALTQPWGRYLPRWLMLLFTWAGGVVLTLHALYGYVVHGLAALGILTWTQVQQLAGAPVTPVSAEDVRELITASLLVWNPWFLLGGILFLVVAWYASRTRVGEPDNAGRR